MTSRESGRVRPRRNGLTVQGWFSVILAVMLALIGAGALGAVVSLGRTLSVTDELTNELLPARAAAHRLQASFLNQETGLRGYALTGDQSFLAPFNDGVGLQQRSTEELRTLIGDRPELFVDVENITRAADEWRAVFTEPILASSPATSAQETAAQTPDPAVYDLGKTAFDDLRDLFDIQNQHLEQARADAQADLTVARQLRTIVFVVMFAAMMVASAVFAILVRTTVINPLRRLAASSRLVVEGDFDRKVDAGNGPADIRSLAEDIEAMRLRIVTELDLVRDRQTRLEEQAAQMDAQAVELRRSNAELEQFAYVTSHDLQEPLRKVASFCQLLEKRYGDSLDDRGRQYIDFAVDGAKRMQVLINDLLAFSRVGRVNDSFRRLDLDRPLDKALSNLETAVEDSGARIDRPAALPEIEGDPMLLTMLWQNLIGNAIKFTRPGVAPEVSISVDERTDSWLICVQDNGIGVGEEFAEKVFVIFQRLHARDEYSGTGIGLSLCKKIVEYHGGEIWLDTTYTTGSRFCFTLPTAIAADHPDTDTIEGASV